MDGVEATVKTELCDPLALLGVIGSEGEPRYTSFSLRAWAESLAPEPLLQELWSDALHRSPMANTLRRAAGMEAVLTVQS